LTSPRLLYVVTEDWYFASHRLPMARAARDAGFDVHVATRVGVSEQEIRREGFTLHHVPFARGRLSPLEAMKTIRAVRALHDEIDPAIAHHVALQPVLLASIAALGRRAVCVNAVTGFGFAFTSRTATARAIRPMFSLALRALLARGGDVALVQNPDDRQTLRALGVPGNRIELIAGSGVDLDEFSRQPEPPAPIVVGFAGRLLLDKGVQTAVEAQRILSARGVRVNLRIAGRPDAANPTSISADTLEQWRAIPGIELLGHVTDMSSFWRRVHIAVLPSRREGLPKALLEAGASGRPLIASDVPGCREVVVPGETGTLVPVDDARALADAIEVLAADASLRARYGAAARRHAEAKFGAVAIARQTVELYDRLLRSHAR
jgi:glycosyltransferase involved in cell wall biosynthesis